MDQPLVHVPPPSPPARPHRWLWLVLAVLAVGGSSGAWYWKTHSKAAAAGRPAVAEENRPHPAAVVPVAVEVVSPQRGGIDRVCVQPGTLEPFEAADLYAKVSGFLAEQSVDIGSRVKRGQMLAKISVPEFEQQVKRNRADVLHAQARVRQYEARLVAARADARAAPSMVVLAEAQLKSKTAYGSYRRKQLERMTELSRKDAIDARVRDESEDNYQAAVSAEDAAREGITVAHLKAEAADANVLSAQADLDEAKAQVQVADAELGKSQAMLDYTRIASPYDGVITRRSFNPGDFVRSADAGGDRTPLFSVERTDKMRVVIQVPDRDVPYADIGDKAKIEIDALPGRVIDSAIARVADSEDSATRTMRTEVDIPNPDGKLRRGMYGRATLMLAGGRPDSLTVPSTAVEGKTDGIRGTVRVVRAGTVHLLPVTVGSDNGVRVEVLTGIREDDRVIIRANGAIAQGTPVAVSGETK